MADYGVAFEAHAQNVLIRMDRSSGSIRGWASRDLGSIKIHTPTLAKSGYVLTSIPKGSLIPTESEEETWRIIQFCLFHNHLNVFIYRLGVDRFAAWAMIRSKLDAFFERRRHQENTERLRAFLFAETIPQKAFMRMKFAQKAAQYEYSTVPNVLLEQRSSNIPAAAAANGADANAAAIQRKKNALANGHHSNGTYTNGTHTNGTHTNGAVAVNGH